MRRALFSRLVKLMRQGPRTVLDFSALLDADPKVVRGYVRVLFNEGAAKPGPLVRQGKHGCTSRTWFIP